MKKKRSCISGRAGLAAPKLCSTRLSSRTLVKAKSDKQELQDGSKRRVKDLSFFLRPQVIVMSSCSHRRHHLHRLRHVPKRLFLCSVCVCVRPYSDLVPNAPDQCTGSHKIPNPKPLDSHCDCRLLMKRPSRLRSRHAIATVCWVVNS